MERKQLIKYAIVGGVVIIAAVWAFRKFVVKKPTDSTNINTQTGAASYIFSQGFHSNYESLLKFDPEFIKDWAAAIKLGTINFTHKGKLYAIKGGKRIS